MNAQSSVFNRILLALMAVLYAISLAVFTYLNWVADPAPSVGFAIINGLILSLPLVLLYGSIYVLVRAWRERRRAGQIDPRLAKIVHWGSRVAAIVIIFFVALFSLDVFEMGGSVLQLIGAFLIHSLPSIILIIMLVFAWRRPVVGFIVFLIAGAAFLVFVIPGMNLGNFVLFCAPLLLISGLFYADWRWTSPQPV